MAEEIREDMLEELVDSRSFYLCLEKSRNWKIIRGFPLYHNGKYYSENKARFLKNGEFHIFTRQELVNLNLIDRQEKMISWNSTEIEKLVENLKPFGFIKLELENGD